MGEEKNHKLGNEENTQREGYGAPPPLVSPQMSTLSEDDIKVIQKENEELRNRWDVVEGGISCPPSPILQTRSFPEDVWKAINDSNSGMNQEGFLGEVAHNLEVANSLPQ